jgi:uncharacterized protein YidB (DUF937 family)
MGILDQVLGNVIASRMGGRGGGLGGLGGAFGGGMGRGGMLGGGMGGGLGKAMLLLLAAKAAHEYVQRRQSTAPGGEVGSSHGGLGGMLAGAGGVGGLGALIEQFRRNGHGDVIDSWINPGPNRRLAPEQLADALGHDTVDELAAEAGMPKQALLEELSETLPDTVDQLTPDGKLPPPDAL